MSAPALLRYAQCWEDADLLLDALEVRSGQVCLSAAAGGDNALALLIRDPARVIAVDPSPAQLACLELRVAAYRALEREQVTELIGSRPSRRRAQLYRRCRPLLGGEARRFWDAHPAAVAAGIGGAGRLERYLHTFRTRILPLVHPRRRVERLLEGGSRAEREAFYDEVWDSPAWRLLYRQFFARFVSARMGRAPVRRPRVEGALASGLSARTRHAFTAREPARNPYLRWMLAGRHGSALPCALRAGNFELIRERLERLELRRVALAEWDGDEAIDRFNLADAFDYVSPRSQLRTLAHLARHARPGARLAWWNLFPAQRRRERDVALLRPLEDCARELRTRDRTPFCAAFALEEVGG